MRKLGCVLLILLLFPVPVVADEMSAAAYYYSDLSAVAWLEGDSVEVALVNESNSHTSVTISTNTMDSRWRPVINQRIVRVPARSIIIESFNLSSFWRKDPILLQISQRYQQLNIEVQVPNIFSPSSYIVRANEEVDIDVDLVSLLDSDKARLVIDRSYRVQGTRAREGRIEVKSVEGGFRYNAYRNTIEYSPPQMELSMRAPQITNVGFITFNVTKEQDGYRGRREVVNGPTILVYGRNVRFAEGRPKPPRRPRLIVR